MMKVSMQENVWLTLDINLVNQQYSTAIAACTLLQKTTLILHYVVSSLVCNDFYNVQCTVHCFQYEYKTVHTILYSRLSNIQ